MCRTLPGVDLYSRENPVSQVTLDGVEDLYVSVESYSEPTVDELSKAIDALSCRKRRAWMAYHLKLYYCGKPALLESSHELLRLC